MDYEDRIEVVDSLFASFLVIAFVFLSLTVCVGSSDYAIQVPSNLGNSQENIDRLEDDGDGAFSFAVVGDTRRGGETTKALFRKIRDENPSFVVLLGDFLREPTIHENKYFTDVVRELGYGGPIFVVPGNHDVAPDDPSSLAVFEDLYGPANFSFAYQGCLFIVLNDSHDDYIEEAYRFLRSTLESEGNEAKHIFVFAHKPPFEWTREGPPRFSERAGRFIDLAQQYDVDYAISGHFHCYYRYEADETVYLVPGSGGQKARRKGRDPLYRAAEIAVDGDFVSERLLSVSAQTKWDYDSLVHRHIVRFFQNVYRSLLS
jgi:predicted phosphodiesterase